MDRTAGEPAAGTQSARTAAPAVPEAVDDRFELFDLRVEVVAPEGVPIQCNARVGDWFEVRGELLHFPPGQPFSMYSLAALLPLLPAKQRPTHPNDWMSTDAEVACPDPHCPTRFRITRLGRRVFSHAQTTAVPLPIAAGDSA
ncbi:MAG: TIGR04076 family protein [Rubrivivax sp.]|jgi:uncharacterized repeat protein (TIGR04076 family)|nr:TIGR04076 family protein [Rubrivivax sp.]